MASDALALARQLDQQGRTAQALAAVEAVLRTNPTSVEAMVLVSELYGKMGKHPYSVQAALRAAQLDPNSFEAMLALATAYHRTGDLGRCDQCLDAAVTNAAGWLRARFYEQLKGAGDADENSLAGRVVLAFDRAAQAADPSPLAIYNLGRLLFALGATDAARQAYERTLDLDTEMAEPFAGLGELEFLQGQFERALEWFEEARRCQWSLTKSGLLYNRERMAQRIASGDVTLGQLDRYSARAKVRLGQFVEANRLMQSAIEWQPWDIDSIRRDMVNEYMAVAQAALETHGAEAAIEIWESVQDTARQANAIELFLRLGHAYVQAAMQARDRNERGQMLDWLNRARNLVEGPPVAIPPEKAEEWNQLRAAVKQAVGKGTGLLSLVR
jgi:tetratricopeptide (TPR) repeat protein